MESCKEPSLPARIRGVRWVPRLPSHLDRRETHHMALGFDDIKFTGNTLNKDMPSTGTIKGARIVQGHDLIILKTKKKIWWGKTTSGPNGAGRLQFEVHPLNYDETEGKFADETITVTVVNPTLPPGVNGPNPADPQPDIP